jgi:5-methyltetrahydropteroyltriglutamate--homocysteine methyltransferase
MPGHSRSKNGVASLAYDDVDGSRHKTVVLGLVSTKTPTMESKDELKKRVEAATRYLDLDCLAVSPQCGFASLDTGNPITPEVQEQKLRLVVELARDVWGEA